MVGKTDVLQRSPASGNKCYHCGDSTNEVNHCHFRDFLPSVQEAGPH